MAGTLMTMPMLIINMGSEMIYVLDQRLKAQNIPRDKASKVLEDIIKTMHNENFMTELFKPHHMYSNSSTRQIFDRIAHSSIMRLNSNSMDKLYDLMRMGFKYQLLSCSSADELVQVTMNHLIHIRALIDAEDVQRLIDETILLTAQTFGHMNPADLFLLKQSLARFYQDTRIKVSLFLQNGIQSMDGTLSIRSDGYTATGGKIPGVVRYFDEDGVDDEEKFDIASAIDAIEAPDVPILEREVTASTLGQNIYELDSKNAAGGKNAKEMIADAKKSGAKGLGDSKPRSFKASASDGLNLLADLLGNHSSDGGAKDGMSESKHFRINLFPDAPSKDGDDADDDKQVPTIYIDATCDGKSAQKLMQDLALDDDDDAKREGKAESDDLLKLMDSAT